MTPGLRPESILAPPSRDGGRTNANFRVREQREILLQAASPRLSIGAIQSQRRVR